MITNELVVLADADNTLWDTDSVFSNAQLLLLAHLEEVTQIICVEKDRLAFVRAYDQALATHHHLYLKYPPQMLVCALAAGLSSTSPENTAESIIAGRKISPALTGNIIDAAVSLYMDALNRTPELLPFVRDGLCLAQQRGLAIYLMTEGGIEKQRRTIAAHGLVDVFSGVWELVKDKAQFDRLRQRFEKAVVVVIGDQPDRDIVPARQAGCLTILVPSRFRPKWHNQNEWTSADLVADNFLDAITWTLAH